MTERWEMEAEREARGIYIKHFSNKPSVLEVGGGQSDQLRRKLPQHTMTPTHHQTAVIVIGRWCVTLSLLYVGFHRVPPPLTCRVPRGPTLSPSRLDENLPQTVFMQLRKPNKACCYVYCAPSKCSVPLTLCCQLVVKLCTTSGRSQ